MKHLFVPYDISLMAKEKGFNEECLTYWIEAPLPNYHWVLSSPNHRVFDVDRKPCKNSVLEKHTYNPKPISAPLYQQLIDWFEKEHGLLIRKAFNPKMYEVILFNNYEKLYSGIGNVDSALKEAFKLIK